MDQIFEFEKANPDVAYLKVSGRNIWTVVRFRLKFLLLQRRLTSSPSGLRFKLSSLLLSIRYFVRNLILFARNVRLIFKRYSYVIVTNNLEVRTLEGRRVDKLAHNLVNTLGEENILVLCYGANGKAEMHSYQNTVAASCIEWLSLFKWVQMEIGEKDQQILQNIQHTFGYRDVLLKDVRKVFAKSMVFKWLLGIWKPQVVFSCCYSNYAEIYAANQAGIDTVEFQHGIIGPLHAGYEAAVPLDKSFTSDNLWTFGSNSTKGLTGNLVNLPSVWPVGNFFLQAIAAAPLDEQEDVLAGRLKVCVPVDAYTEEHILGFLLKVYTRLPDVLFLINPRVQLSGKGRTMIEGIPGFKVIDNMSFQLLVRYCDIHTATDSTCCLEALSLGVQNILINDNGSAFRYYGMLTDPLFTKFADDTDAYIHYMNNYIPSPKEAIIVSNQGNYMANNLQRIQEGLAKIGAC